MNAEQVLHLVGVCFIVPMVLVGVPSLAILFYRHRRAPVGTERCILVLFDLCAGLLVLALATLLLTRPSGWAYALLFMCAFPFNAIGVAAIWARSINVRILAYGLAAILVVLLGGLGLALSLPHLTIAGTGDLLRNYASFSGVVALGIAVLFLVSSAASSPSPSPGGRHAPTKPEQ